MGLGRNVALVFGLVSEWVLGCLCPGWQTCGDPRRRESKAVARSSSVRVVSLVKGVPRLLDCALLPARLWSIRPVLSGELRVERSGARCSELGGGSCWGRVKDSQME